MPVSAIKQARSRDESESALLQNANTPSNGLLTLSERDVAQAQLTRAFLRNIIKGRGIRQTLATLSVDDIKLLLVAFADVE
ncbi:unnamed protein product [Rotaria sordida]|uniref:E3 ubiquitin ligase UBR4 C-terminal domain-containing protein n=1 Tax=Rotaria sordida TaxID=392033 RepID=A0A815IQ69_9BILA|nr:unnamed protein product [Rotaria sordida]